MAEKEEQPTEPRELQGEEKGAKSPRSFWSNSFTSHPLQLPLSHFYQQMPFLNTRLISALVHFQGMKSAGTAAEIVLSETMQPRQLHVSPCLVLLSHPPLMSSDCDQALGA